MSDKRRTFDARSVDWQTGDLFVSTDFGVNLLRSSDTQRNGCRPAVFL